ncbi:RtcB family protein [Nonomuraea africana]|uniref:tRNA-splicing ligase RtcB n=1 Tax=Nonomuraea africana TaxID=46171 RepID=A0ABR9KB59_9ACTN|nr:RtcB family protein [Nonomuraea africana]MBE1559251.1 tRNA-splicing ligase RtcB [Nonomuraea africana]
MRPGAIVELVEETPFRWRIERQGAMRVPGVVFATRELLPDPSADQSLAQVAAVATLPGIVEAAYAMPDMHWGYGFPIGGVAATDIERGGVVSPGGVGFDISCGVRLLLADLHVDRLRPRLTALMDALDAAIPRGMGQGAVWRLRRTAELEQILAGGARYAVERGHGEPNDLDRCEDRGAVADADPGAVGRRARDRGLEQVGSLGSGNHFLEVEAVAQVYDEPIAQAYGLWPGRICLMIHTGSRGLGHQICTDFVRTMEAAMARYGISVPDRQLACAPVASAEGRAYLAAMAAAANYGRANRQLLGQAARRAFDRATGHGDLILLYDVSHNLAKLETHQVDGQARHLCVHRKGATLALPPGHEDLPPDLRPVGQPVLVPGSMGAGSYVLAGMPGAPAFASACHGAGRRLSRHQAMKTTTAARLRAELEAAGIAVRGASARGLTEETPQAYKDVDAVVDACQLAGLARKVAKLAPVGVVKG